MEQLYASQSPPVCNPTLCVAPHHVRVPSRRKYVFTDQIDQLIRAVYLNHRDAKTRLGIRPLAKKVGMPHWALSGVNYSFRSTTTIIPDSCWNFFFSSPC